MVLIVQMVKLAAPTKQQTIHSNKYTNIQTHTNHLLGLLIQTKHANISWMAQTGSGMVFV